MNSKRIFNIDKKLALLALLWQILAFLSSDNGGILVPSLLTDPGFLFQHSFLAAVTISAFFSSHMLDTERWNHSMLSILTATAIFTVSIHWLFGHTLGLIESAAQIELQNNIPQTSQGPTAPNYSGSMGPLFTLFELVIFVLPLGARVFYNTYFLYKIFKKEGAYFA